MTAKKLKTNAPREEWRTPLPSRVSFWRARFFLCPLPPSSLSPSPLGRPDTQATSKRLLRRLISVFSFPSLQLWLLELAGRKRKSVLGMRRFRWKMANLMENARQKRRPQVLIERLMFKLEISQSPPVKRSNGTRHFLFQAVLIRNGAFYW